MIDGKRVVMNPLDITDKELGGFNNFMCMKQMEREDAIERVYTYIKTYYRPQYDADEFTREALEDNGIDPDSLTRKEFNTINRIFRRFSYF